MKFVTKKIILWFSLILSFILLSLIIAQNSFCYDVSWCRSKWDLINSLGEGLFVMPLVLLFSLITYRMKDEVFQKWIRFAVWYIPLLMIGYFIYPQGGGLVASSFDAFVFILFISIFVITSIVKIVRAHKSSR